MKETRVFLEVDINAVTKCPAYSDRALIAKTDEKTERIRAEGILVNPNISFCLVAGYLNRPDREDENREVEVDFAGTICSVPLSAIKKIILRP